MRASPGKAGNDLLKGGRGRDLLVGGRGTDRMASGPGNDVIRAADGRADRLVNGGGGVNSCVVDIPVDLPSTVNCGTIQAGPQSAGGGGAPRDHLGPGIDLPPARARLRLHRLATGTYTCTGSGNAYLMVHIGTKSTPQMPVACG